MDLSQNFADALVSALSEALERGTASGMSAEECGLPEEEGDPEAGYWASWAVLRLGSEARASVLSNAVEPLDAGELALLRSAGAVYEWDYRNLWGFTLYEKGEDLERAWAEAKRHCERVRAGLRPEPVRRRRGIFYGRA